jgi:carboxypeptidase T
MKNTIIILGIILTFSCIHSYTIAQTQPKYSKVKVELKAGDLNRLASLGVAVDNGEIKKDQYIIAEFSEREIGIIQQNGFKYEILIDDMAKFYADRNQKDQENQKKKSVNAVNCSVDKYPTPNYFSLGSFAGFYSYEEIMVALDSMHQRFPNLVSIRQDAGSITTLEGRHLWYVKISDNPGTDEAEPEILYSALTHAREPEGMQQLFFFMYYLLENYNTNSTIKYIVDNTELFFVPCVNPDGYKYNQTTNASGGGMHRKNCRVTGASNFGIDLNRNYGFNWGIDDVGSSPNIEDDTYRGTAGFSEAETQIMKGFCESRNFKLLIDYHCYSNVLLYPWGYDNILTPDSALFRIYSTIMTKENGFAIGTPYQALGYNANGGSFDWFYGEQITKPKIIAWSPESGSADDGFWPASSRIEPIAKSFADMNFQMALFAGKYAKITDNNSHIISTDGYLKFAIQSLGLDTPATFTVSLIPVNSAITGTGTQKVFSSMHLVETRNDSISFILDASLQPGSEIKYLYKIESQVGIYYSDTMTKIFGTPTDIFYDQANATTNWTASATWNTTTSAYHSPSKSFTDSPSGNYTNNANKTFTTNNYISITNAVYAELTFWAKWDIEAGYDYVEVLASTNGTTWTPLCGKYTHSGSTYQDADNPLYDGTQDTWIQEQIDLSSYIGQSIKLRFKIKSDTNTNADGFYFDDLKVTIIDNTTEISENSRNINSQLNCQPNPCNNEILFNYTPTNSILNLEIYNVVGEKYKTITLNPTSKNTILNTTELPSGIYLAKLSNGKSVKFVKK